MFYYVFLDSKSRNPYHAEYDLQLVTFLFQYATGFLPFCTLPLQGPLGGSVRESPPPKKILNSGLGGLESKD